MRIFYLIAFILEILFIMSMFLRTIFILKMLIIELLCLCAYLSAQAVSEICQVRNKFTNIFI